MVHHGISSRPTASATSRLRRAHRQVDRRLRTDRGRQGPGPARQASGLPLLFDVDDVSSTISTPAAPHTVQARRRLEELSATSSPAATASTACPDRVFPRASHEFHREYPYGWLGILAEVAPSHDELIYAHHERGFALLACGRPSSRRLYLQCAPDDALDGGRTSASGRSYRRVSGSTAGRCTRARCREGHHADAQLRRRADAVGEALPRGRRGPHRAADRRKGSQPRRAGRAGARRSARRAVPGGDRPGSTRTRRRACAGSGAPSTSRGG